jgi:multidrug efflux pump subunit AcrB
VGRFRDAREIENLSLEVSSSSSPSSPSRRVYLRDFAEVIDDTEDQRVFVYLNRQPAVKFSIQKQPEANTITVVDAVKRRIEQLRQSPEFDVRKPAKNEYSKGLEAFLERAYILNKP